jgi:effector-binding domain-containing protein
MFTEKNTMEIVTLEEIKVAGLSLEKFGFPKKAEKLGELWGVYESKYRKKIAIDKTPVVDYGFWFNRPDNDYDYFVGSAVTDLGDIDSELTAYIIPAGRYIKVSFNAKDFGNLVSGDDLRNSFEKAKKNAEENNFKIKSMPPFPITGIEVYPHELMCVGKENGPEWGLTLDNAFITPPLTQFPEMYTLTPIE